MASEFHCQVLYEYLVSDENQSRAQLKIGKLPLYWDITPITRCRGSELWQAIPKDVQGITLDNGSIECLLLWNYARKEGVLVL